MISGLETAQDCMLEHRLEAPYPGKTKQGSLVCQSFLRFPRDIQSAASFLPNRSMRVSLQGVASLAARGSPLLLCQLQQCSCARRHQHTIPACETSRRLWQDPASHVAPAQDRPQAQHRKRP